MIRSNLMLECKDNCKIICLGTIRFRMIILLKNVSLKVLFIHKKIYLRLSLGSLVEKDIFRQINRFCKGISNKEDRLLVLGYKEIKISKQKLCFFHLGSLRIIQFWLIARIEQEIGKFIVRIILFKILVKLNRFFMLAIILKNKNKLTYL